MKKPSDFVISIHALREEGDQINMTGTELYAQISIHALREEGDPLRPASCWGKRISIHALREEGDLVAPPGAAA